MKSVFFYLVLIVLFLAGTRLVSRQQEYTRSKPAPSESATITDIMTTRADEPKIQPNQKSMHQPVYSETQEVHSPRSTTTNGLRNVNKQHKRTAGRTNES